MLHDKSSNLYAAVGPAPTSSSEDRRVRGLPGGSQRQRSATIGGMSDADTTAFIEYDSAPKGIVARVPYAEFTEPFCAISPYPPGAQESFTTAGAHGPFGRHSHESHLERRDHRRE